MAFLAGLTAAALTTRTLVPIDETRYAAVGWEMWLRGDWLVPHLDGAPYSEKGPVFFWLIALGWAMLGVRDWWPQLLPPLCAAISLVETAVLARLLWPDRPLIARRAPLLLFGSLLFCALSTVLVTDGPLLALMLLALVALALAWRGGGSWPWFAFGTAIGLGILTKGPVALLHCLPLALLAPWWTVESRPREWLRWYGRVGAATLWAAAVALGWALPASVAGGEAYGDAILWHQTAGRVVHSFAHAKKWWWYLAIAPALILPYSLWPRAWRAARSLAQVPLDAGTRFCLTWIAVPFAVFSMISGKQVHYLLPMLAGFVLLLSRALEAETERSGGGDQVVAALLLLIGGVALLVLPLVPPIAALFHSEIPVLGLLRSAGWWLGLPLLALAAWLWRSRATTADGAVLRIAAAVFVLGLAIHFGALRALRPAYDVTDVGVLLRRAEEQGRPMANAGSYQGQFQFAGRLSGVPELIDESEIEGWFETHPDGVVVSYARHAEAAASRIPPEIVRPYRGRILIVWTRDSFRARLAASPPGR